MKVALCVPAAHSRTGVPAERKAPFSSEHLGLGYLSAALAAAGIETRVFDGHRDSQSVEETAARLLGYLGPGDLLGISTTLTSVPLARRLLTLLRAGGFSGKAVLGGWEASLAAREVLGFIPAADFVLRGEAESSLPSLARALQQGSPVGLVPGIVCRKANGELLFGEPPMPADFASLLPHRSGPDLRSTLVPVQSSRGCAYGLCSFCTTPALDGKRWRSREPRKVVDEMESLVGRRGARNFIFVDDEFLGPNRRGFDRARRFCREVRGRGLKASLTLDCRVSDWDDHLFGELRASGLTKVFLGIESGSDGVLRRLQKGYDAGVAKRNIRRFKALGIEVITGYILFEPYMNLAELREAFQFLVEEVDDLTPSRFVNSIVPYVGTAVHARLARDNLLSGTYPELSYRFLDPDVERFYRDVKAALEPVTSDFKAMMRRTAAPQMRKRRCRAAAEKAAALFDGLLARAGH